MMTNRKASLMKRVKMAWNSAAKAMRKLAGEAREKIDIDSQFSRLALKWDRISTGMVKLHPTFLGIFDREALTLTIRAESSLQKGELIETDHIQYRIEEMRPDRVELPLEIEHLTHLISCKVAVLARI